MKEFNFNDLLHKIRQLAIGNNNDNNRVRNQFKVAKFIESFEFQSDKNLKKELK